MFCWTTHLKADCGRLRAPVAVGHEIYCFGHDEGSQDRDQIEVHVFNTVSLCWRKLTPAVTAQQRRDPEAPAGREGHTAVLLGGTVYLWGGLPYCKVLYAFDVSVHRWSRPRVSGAVPEPRTNHWACGLGNAMFIHGGWKGNVFADDIHKLDTATTTPVWSLINTGGIRPHTMFHSMHSIIGTKMLVFRSKEWYCVFDTEKNLWMNLCSHNPPYIYSQFTYNGEWYNFYRWYSFITLWKYNPREHCQKMVRTKRNRACLRMKNMCCCVSGDRVVLFRAGDTSGDLYVLDISPSLKTLCKLAVIEHQSLDRSKLTHNIRWELAAMTGNSSQGP